MQAAEARLYLTQFAQTDAVIAETFVLTGMHSTYADFCRARMLLASLEGRLVSRQRRQYSQARATLLWAVQRTVDWVYSQMLWLECN